MTARPFNKNTAYRVTTPPADAETPPATCPPGRPWPLGATLRDGGVNFAVYASAAERVEICLFDEQETERRVALSACIDDVWHAFVHGLGAGTR